jgi:hypothetical protein
LLCIVGITHIDKNTLPTKSPPKTISTPRILADHASSAKESDIQQATDSQPLVAVLDYGMVEVLYY